LALSWRLAVRWSELPRSARYYILYHAMVAPLLLTWYMVPYDFLEEGYTVLELGILLTAVNVFLIPAKLLVGRYFTFHDVKRGLLLIDVLESTSLLLLGFVARMFDSAWFVFNRNWLFKTVSREEAALISAGVSALNSTVFLAMPLVTGTLAAISPSLPYLAGFLLMVSTLPLLIKGVKDEKERIV